MSIKLPLGAEDHIPEPWKLWESLDSIGIIFPSVSGGENHTVVFHRADRSLTCDCKGFWFNGEVCRHVKLVVATLHLKARKRKGMQSTSLKAYWLLTKEELARCQRIVLNALGAYGPKCNRELSEITGMPINSVTARINNCYKMGFVKDAGRKLDSKTNRTVIVWALEE